MLQTLGTGTSLHGPHALGDFCPPEPFRGALLETPPVVIVVVTTSLTEPVDLAAVLSTNTTVVVVTMAINQTYKLKVVRSQTAMLLHSCSDCINVQHFVYVSLQITTGLEFSVSKRCYNNGEPAMT